MVLLAFVAIFAGLLAAPMILLDPSQDPVALTGASPSGNVGTAFGTTGPATGTPTSPVGPPATSGAAPLDGATPNDPTAGAVDPIPDGPVGGVARTASDQGVTPDEIRVGILVFTLGTASDIGVNLPGLSPEEQIEAWTAYIDGVNAGGGVLGRTIVPVYREYDPLDSDSLRAACVFMGEDAGVFAVLAFAGYGADDALCITQRYGLPFLARDGAPEANYAAAGGNLFSSGEMSYEKTLRTLVWFLDRAGELQGQRVGVISFEGDEAIIDASLVAPLAALGVEVAHISHFSTDQSSAAAQAPLEVAQMRAQGVTAVVVATEFIVTSLFTQEAESQGYIPRYWASDYQTMVGGTQGRIQGRRSWANMVGVTALREGEPAAGIPAPAYDADCEARFQAATGRLPDATSDHRVMVLTTCSHVDLFRRAAQVAGVELTRAGWRASTQSLGPVNVAAIGPASYAPGKFFAPDAVRSVAWDGSCQCIVPTSDFVAIPPL